MSEVEQVPDRMAHARLVVGVDVERTPGVDVAVEHDDRYVETLERPQHVLVALVANRNDQAVDAALVEQGDVDGVEVGASLGVGEQHRVAGAA